MQTNRISMMQIMAERGYDLADIKVDRNNQYSFINKSKQILCMINTVTKQWHLVYANKNLVGFFDTGEFPNYRDDVLFSKVQSDFMIGVEQLKKLDNIININEYQE